MGFNKTIAESIKNSDADIVLVASDHIENGIEISIEGFRYVGAFEGYLCWKTGIYEPDFYWLFEKIEQPKK